MAMRALGNGAPRDAVAQVFDISERTLCGSIRNFNAGGIHALLDKKRRGRPRVIDAESFRQKVAPLLADAAAAGECHWTAVKLHGYLQSALQVELGYSTLVRRLHEEGWVLRIPRPWPLPPNDEQWERKRAAFRPQLAALLADPQAVVFFQDECGIEGDRRPRSTWALKGSHPLTKQTGSPVRLNVLSAVAPASGACSALIFEGCDTDVFQTFLDTLAADAPPGDGKRFYLVLDNASWHKAKRLHWHHFEPVYLPPYSPDFNAIERLWLHLKSQWFAGFIARTTEALMERTILALQSIFAQPDLVASQCRISAENF
jgi:transposase